MSFSFEGLEQVKLRLMRVGDAVTSVANEQMQAMANELRQKARDMAPIDYGDLKSAIQLRAHAAAGVKATGGRFTSLRDWTIFVNNEYPARDKDKPENTVVGDYAWLVHQYMGYGSVQGFLPGTGHSFNPSEESVAAGRAAGVEAGGLFMERATEALRDDFQKRLAAIVRKVIVSDGLDI